MARGISPAELLAAESLPGAISECMEILNAEVDEEMEEDGDDSFCSSVVSWDSDYAIDFGLEPSETTQSSSLVELGDSSSSSSGASCASDSEIGLTIEACLENAVAPEGAGRHQSGGFRKIRRLAGDKDCARSRRSLLSSAEHQAAATELNLIILDWDDTLMPSTWLQQQSLSILPSSLLPNDAQRAELRGVACVVIKTLQKAKQLGHVVIVTNAEKGWVELSCCKFLPEVLPLLEGVKVVSARSTFEPSTVASPLSPVLWKRQAFDREIADFLKTPANHAGPGCRNTLVSVGDSMQERIALLEAAGARDSWRKSWKLLEKPSPKQLVEQHEFLCSCFRPFVDYEGNLDLCLPTPSEFCF